MIVEDASVPVLYTVGHGNRTEEELLELLHTRRILQLIDVRRHPGSRRHPHFARAALEKSLPQAGIHYVWEEALGGRRRPQLPSPNIAWREESFRGYADYMSTASFKSALDRVLALAGSACSVVMCAERLPWQCHRNLIADVATAQGWRVMHLIDAGSARIHALNPAARQSGAELIYDRLGQPPLL